MALPKLGAIVTTVCLLLHKLWRATVNRERTVPVGKVVRMNGHSLLEKAVPAAAEAAPPIRYGSPPR
ncbi:hypothetical protein [Mesorhizobium sp. WSM3224]|uniref:hypothetical protein n=1 Tax=Mesorhizobium sp. WSM3224 TaxID=1040986 RepID=UPI00042A075C|nr:hypothetical protein [Mesorhizobium sp. WSM3224]